MFPYGSIFTIQDHDRLRPDAAIPEDVFPIDLRSHFPIIGAGQCQVMVNLETGQVRQFSSNVHDDRGFGVLAESIEEYLELELMLRSRGCVAMEEHALVYCAPADGKAAEYPATLDLSGMGSPSEARPA